MSDEMPETPYWVITIRWDSETGEITVDARGMGPYETHTILQKAADRVYEDLDEPTIIWDDLDLEEPRSEE